MIWQYLPEQHKAAVSGAVTEGSVPVSPVRGQAPPPAYVFHHCHNQSNCGNGIEGLCDFGADDILYAGIHNGQAAANGRGWILHRSKSRLLFGFRPELWIPSHKLDIRVCNGELALVHSYCKLGTSTLLNFSPLCSSGSTTTLFSFQYKLTMKREMEHLWISENSGTSLIQLKALRIA